MRKNSGRAIKIIKIMNEETIEGMKNDDEEVTKEIVNHSKRLSKAFSSRHRSQKYKKDWEKLPDFKN